MPGLGLRLQLSPPTEPVNYAALPTLRSISEYTAAIPGTAYYVGRGSAKHRLAKSILAPPYRDGIDGDPEYCLALFTSQLHTYQDMLAEITRLAEHVPWCDTLVVDTPPGHPSHAEAIAKAIWEHRSETALEAPPRQMPPVAGGAKPRPSQQQPRVVPPRRVPAAETATPKPPPVRPTRAARPAAPMAGKALGAMMPTVANSLEAHVFTAWRWSDVEVHRAIRKMFPEPVLRDVALPPLEDLVNDPRLASWRCWAQEHGINATVIHTQMQDSGWRALALGDRRGVTGSKHAVDAVVGFGMGKAEHFRAALRCAEQREDPLSLNTAAPPDLQFAAERTAESIGSLRDVRQSIAGLIRELASRTIPLSTRLRQAQLGHVRQVAGKLALGFITVCVLLMLWPDAKMPGRFISGFQGISTLEETRLWAPVDLPEPETEEWLFQQYPANRDAFLHSPLSEDAQFLWDSCVKEQVKNVGLRPVPEQVLIDKYGRGGYTAIPCFVHTQASGKQRRIDNAKRSGDNKATRYSEKFRLPNAFAPALSARMLLEAGMRQKLPPELIWRLLDLESGGEDLPDAFRSIPSEKSYLKHNIVMVKHPRTGALRFVQMLAALFGQGASVFGFERWSAFLAAAPRRLLWLLWVMYVDDGSLTEPAAAKGSGQALTHAFFHAVGTGLSPDKREWLSKQATFLGVEHDLSELATTHAITFWPRQGIEDELRAMIAYFKHQRICTPGDASKFRGVWGFATQAQFGQLGRAPMRAFKQRQYSDKSPWSTSATMDRAIEFIEMLLDCKLSKKVNVARDERPSIVVATDAQVEPNEWPGGGSLVADPHTGRLFGGYLQFQGEALEIWDLTLADIAAGRQPIALCEAAMVPTTLMAWPEAFRGRRVVWYVDNTSAMASFVKGASANEFLEKIVALLWMCAYHLDAQIWFEWVDSDSNWSDGVSREFQSDPLAQELGFSLESMEEPTLTWSGSWLELWNLAQRSCGSSVG